jgi:Uma2 family endonuclease
MTTSKERTVITPPFPDHTQLPDEDGTFVKNFQEHPQSIILTDSIIPVLQQIHPDGQYAIGQDCGIYWRETDPPEKGAESPDWFYVGNVPPTLNGQLRRSYVLRREYISPLIALEFASGDGSEERDKTPLSRSPEGEKIKPGKFWVYERIIHIPYYGIYVIGTGTLEVYSLVNGSYQLLEPNERGHYPIEPLGVELGLWFGSYPSHQPPLLWLRWWDKSGNLLLIGSERAELETQRAEQERLRAEQETQRAEQERQRAEQEQERAETLEKAQQDAIPRLLGLGLSVEQVASALSLSVEQVREAINRNS